MFYPQSYFLAVEAVRSACVRQRKALAPVVWRLIDFTFDLFHGVNPAFEPCDTAFHDFDHTMQATEVVLRLLAASDRRPGDIRFTDREWELAVMSVLLHDAGYLKRREDHEGSGAKYTNIHVGRSCFLAWDLLPAFGLNKDDLRLVQQAICATALEAKLNEIGFRSRSEWLIGALVATGDMLGQMAADDYPERLPALYLELKEAAVFSRLETTGDSPGGQTLLELLCGTERFFSDYVLKTMDAEWEGVYHWLDAENGSNLYLDRIRHNVERTMAMGKILQLPIARRNAP
jgi:hypothetical protein